MIRAYEIRDGELKAVSYDDEQPCVFITTELLKTLYTLSTKDLAEINKQLSQAIPTSMVCQLIVMSERDGEYYVHECDTPDAEFTIPFKKGKRIGGG